MFEPNRIYMVVVSPVQHFYLAVNAKGVVAEAYSMKRARLYAPEATGDVQKTTYDEYLKEKF